MRAVYSGIQRAVTSPFQKKGYPNSPGSKTEADVLTVYTSRRFAPSLRPAANAVVTASDGAEYSLNGGAWSSEAGVWGNSKYVQIRGTSSENYEITVTFTVTIDGVAYDFLVTTLADATNYLYFGADQVLFGTDEVTL